MNKFAYYLCIRGCTASLWLVSFIYLIAIEGEVGKISHFGTLLLIEAGAFAKELVSFLKQRNAEKHQEDIRLTDLILLCITLGAAMTVVCFWGNNVKISPLIIIDFVVYLLLIIIGFIHWILAKKPKYFYLIDEHSEIPKKFHPIEQTNQKMYAYKGNVYEALEAGECYSGYMVTLAKLPIMDYDELIAIATESKYADERIGAIGLILRRYPEKLCEYLSNPQVSVSKRTLHKFAKEIANMDILFHHLKLDQVLKEAENILRKPRND